jgi:hypothetical protein
VRYVNVCVVPYKFKNARTLPRHDQSARFLLLRARLLSVPLSLKNCYSSSANDATRRFDEVRVGNNVKFQTATVCSLWSLDTLR